jgi:nitric oxide reductase subunit B
MTNTIQPVAKTFLALALLMLLLGLGLGVTAAHSYLYPDLWKNSAVGFSALRPMHVSSVLFWIILGATGCVYSGLWYKYGHLLSARLATVQLALWIIAIVWIFYNYLHSDFGGREYWEFNPWPHCPLLYPGCYLLSTLSKWQKKSDNGPYTYGCG